MIVHIFKGAADWFGVTTNETGQNLPPERGPWTHFKVSTLVPGQTLIAMDADEAIEAINARGYFLCQARVEVS